MKTEEIYKGKSGEPVVEGTTFGWIIHGGDFPIDECMYCRDVSDYQMLYTNTLVALKENTYVDNLMKTGDSVEELDEFKYEATTIMEEGKFLVHKWESNIQSLESMEMPNPGKILGLTWHKRDDAMEIQVPERK